jgi:hypothetical protein
MRMPRDGSLHEEAGAEHLSQTTNRGPQDTPQAPQVSFCAAQMLLTSDHTWLVAQMHHGVRPFV